MSRDSLSPCNRADSGPIITALERAYVRLRSRVRYSHFVWELAAWLLAIRALLTIRSLERYLLLLSQAYRRAKSRLLKALLEVPLRKWTSGAESPIWRTHKIGWYQYAKQGVESPYLIKSLILKAPQSAKEPGVLYLSFELEWIRLLEHTSIESLLESYLLVGATSWSPPDYRAIWSLASLGRHPFFLQISNLQEQGAIERVAPHVRELPILASHWIDGNCYSPLPKDARDIDIIMVAGWAPFKRHWLLFDALRKMGSDLRVVLVGQELLDGYTADEVSELARLFQVDDRVTFVRDASPDMVARLLCRSKVSLILSKIEGSNKVIAESLFADTPVGVPRDSEVGSTAFVNENTGLTLGVPDIRPQLEHLVASYRDFSPRKWALQHIECRITSRRLNNELRDYCVAVDIPWTKDIVPFRRRPVPEYLTDEVPLDLETAYEKTREEYGLKWRYH